MPGCQLHQASYKHLGWETGFLQARGRTLNTEKQRNDDGMAIQTQISGKSPGAEIRDKEGKVVSFYYHQYKTQRMTLHMERNLYADQGATVRTGHGTTDWIQIGKGVRQGCILSPCLFNWRRQWHPHSSTLAWKILWMEEPGRLQSMGSLRIRYD